MPKPCEDNLRRRHSFFGTVIRSRLMWVAAAFVIGGGTCLVAGLDLCWLEWQYHSAALQTRGTVLRKWKGSSTGGSILGTGGGGWMNGPSGSVAYYGIRYRYDTAAGEAHEDEDDVGGAYWEKLKPGDSLQVFYLLKLPNHSRLWRGTRLFLPACLLGVGVPMTTMGVLVEFFIVSDLRRKQLRVRDSRWKRPLSSKRAIS